MVRQGSYFSRYVLSLLWSLMSTGFVAAYNYQEHKTIGNAAFASACRQLVATGRIADSLTVAGWLSQYAQMDFNPKTEDWYFPALSHLSNQISYGELNALSGDHAQNPLDLQDQLRYQYSALNRVVQLQQEYAGRFYTNAPDGELFRLDKQYGYFALFHFSHFNDYGKGLAHHLRGVRKANIEALQRPAEVERIFRSLSKTNAIEMYVTLHAFALHLAQQGGASLRAGDGSGAGTFLYYALLYNAFADHFLQDACSAGHLVVRRSVVSSVTNNKAIHDFFNRTGLTVINLNGDVWTTQGDGYLSAPDKSWHKATTYTTTLELPTMRKYQQVVKATTQSIFELLAAFARAQQDGQVTLLKAIPNDPVGPQQTVTPDSVEQFYIGQFKALSIIPVPYGSDLRNYPLPDSLRALNRLPFFRDHIHRRIAHSATGFAGALRPLSQSSLPLYFIAGGRYVFSPQAYHYQDHYHKAATVDRWYGYTASLTRGFRFGDSNQDQADKITGDLTQLQVGVYHKADIWVSDDRYMGFHVYLEGGAAWYAGRFQPVLSPVALLELFPLLFSIRKSYPKSLILPLRVLMPLSVTYAYQLTPSYTAQQLFSIEVKLTF